MQPEIEKWMEGDGGLWLRIADRTLREVSHGYTSEGTPRATYLADNYNSRWMLREEAPERVRDAWLAAFGAWPGEPELDLARDPQLLITGFDPSDYTPERNQARAERRRRAIAKSLSAEDVKLLRAARADRLGRRHVDGILGAARHPATSPLPYRRAVRSGLIHPWGGEDRKTPEITSRGLCWLAAWEAVELSGATS